MATLSEILRWLVYRWEAIYNRFVARVMRRDRLLLRSEKKFEALLESAPDAMVIVNWHGHIALANAQAQRLFGYRREEMLGQHIGLLIPEHLHARHREHQKSYLKDARTRPMGGGRELYARRKDGIEFPVEISLSPLETDQGLLVSSAIRDITERKDSQRLLRHLADHDALTGLLNRRSFEEHLERELALAIRHGVDGAMLVIDIDALKDVNDTLGHARGDELIRSVATVITKRMRETDIVARVGGDEFGVLLPHTELDAARNVAEELVATIRGHVVVLNGQRVRLSASIGVASFLVCTQAAENIMVCADLALYEAKDSGRDRVRVYVPEQAHAAERQLRASWTQRIREALDEGRLVAYRQPIMRLADRTIRQYELLVRMIDEDGSAISPSAFLPTAERTGMIREIDRFMVNTAIDLIARASGAAAPVSYEVNLSARSLADPELLRAISTRLRTSEIDPSLLVFEITETAAIANMDEAREFANALRRLGCGFTLDDFGAGFASFYYLKHMPLDALKIDGEFIRNLPRSPDDPSPGETIGWQAQSTPRDANPNHAP